MLRSIVGRTRLILVSFAWSLVKSKWITVAKRNLLSDWFHCVLFHSTHKKEQRNEKRKLCRKSSIRLPKSFPGISLWRALATPHSTHAAKGNKRNNNGIAYIQHSVAPRSIETPKTLGSGMKQLTTRGQINGSDFEQMFEFTIVYFDV